MKAFFWIFVIICVLLSQIDVRSKEQKKEDEEEEKLKKKREEKIKMYDDFLAKDDIPDHWKNYYDN